MTLRLTVRSTGRRCRPRHLFRGRRHRHGEILSQLTGVNYFQWL